MQNNFIGLIKFPDIKKYPFMINVFYIVIMDSFDLLFLVQHQKDMFIVLKMLVSEHNVLGKKFVVMSDMQNSHLIIIIKFQEPEHSFL